MHVRDIEYRIGETTYTGYLADGSGGRLTAGVLVAPEGNGLTDHPKERARSLAELGYVTFAMDTFGEVFESMDKVMPAVAGLMADLPTLRGRAGVALDLLKSQTNVDAGRTAAIGFCFGGTTVLELARAGADVACVVGFHAGLQTSAPADAKNIRGRVLVCLGARDPIVTVADRDQFVAEMLAGDVDAEMMLFSGAGHSFTNRHIDALNMPGFAYHAEADRRSWRAMLCVFDDAIGPVY